mgnify:FL=1
MFQINQLFPNTNRLRCDILFDNLWLGLMNDLKIYSKFIANLIEMEATQKEYQEIVSQCRSLFEKKMSDYGAAWRILRLPSLTDQIFIKAQRIRSLQTQSERKVDEGEVSEFIGIVNYSVMALIQIKLGVSEQVDLDLKEAFAFYCNSCILAVIMAYM